jgi:hypothetical protein
MSRRPSIISAGCAPADYLRHIHANCTIQAIGKPEDWPALERPSARIDA